MFLLTFILLALAASQSASAAIKPIACAMRIGRHSPDHARALAEAVKFSVWKTRWQWSVSEDAEHLKSAFCVVWGVADMPHCHNIQRFCKLEIHSNMFWVDFG